MEDENTSATQEVAYPEQESNVVSTEDNQAVQPVETEQERHWKEARAVLKELRRENRYLKEEMQKLKEPQKADPDDDEPYITPNKLKKELQSLRQQLKSREAESVEDLMRSRFSDFDEVVSNDNVEYLKQNDPELALSLQSLSDDPYKQAVAAYKLLKKTDYYMNKNSREDRQKIADNNKKPMSVQAVRKQGALSEANRFMNGLTPELKKSLFQEMQQARKGA